MRRQAEAGKDNGLLEPQHIFRIKSSEPGSKNEVSKERRNPESPTDFVEVA